MDVDFVVALITHDVTDYVEDLTLILRLRLRSPLLFTLLRCALLGVLPVDFFVDFVVTLLLRVVDLHFTLR